MPDPFPIHAATSSLITTDAWTVDPDADDVAEQADDGNDPALDWHPVVPPGWSDSHKTIMRRINRKVLVAALCLSICVHAMGAGAIYLVLHRQWSSPRLLFAKSERSIAGNTLTLESADTATIQASPVHNKGPVHPTPAMQAIQPASDEESQAWDMLEQPKPAVPQMFQDPDLTASIDAVPTAEFHPIALPILEKAPAPTIGSAPLAASSAANTILQTTPPQVNGGAASTGNSHSKNGYDNRGLPIPDYPAESRRRREQGLVLLDVEIKSDGTTGVITAIKDAGYPLLSQAAIQAVRQASFIPAQLNGSAVTGHLRIPFRFVLE